MNVSKKLTPSGAVDLPVPTGVRGVGMIVVFAVMCAAMGISLLPTRTLQGPGFLEQGEVQRQVVLDVGGTQVSTSVQFSKEVKFVNMVYSREQWV